MDVVVPGGSRGAAALFCEGVACGIRLVCGGIRGYRVCEREPLHASKGLDSGSGAHC